MGTDISNLKKQYRTVTESKQFPDVYIIDDIAYKKVDWSGIGVRYGTNPNQPSALYRLFHKDTVMGNLEFLKMGKGGPSLTNLEDVSHALNILKYVEVRKAACAVMKHLNPSGFSVSKYMGTKPLVDIYKEARDCDERSAFGSIVAFNCVVDDKTADEIMKTFVEGVVAVNYHQGALDAFNNKEGKYKINKDIRIMKVDGIGIYHLPKFDGDDIDFYNIKTQVDGSIALETPYLTSIRGKEDLILDAEIQDKEGNKYEVKTKPTEQQIEDMLTAWYININVRSNGIVFVKDGRTIAVGTGEQERVGAVEQAIDKAIKKGHKHDLEGSVMSSDAFFPQRDCIDTVANYGVSAIIYPGGSINDIDTIKAANEHNMALAITGERCFSYF